MGGTIAVTVRFSAESEYRMLWGTGGLNTFKRKGFLCRDTEFLEESKARWAGADLKGSLAPTDYGLVVADFVTNQIVSCQSYSDLRSIHIVGLRSRDWQCQDVIAMIGAGKIRDLEYERYVWGTKERTVGVASIPEIHNCSDLAFEKIVRWHDRGWQLRAGLQDNRRKRVSLTPDRFLLHHDFQIHTYDHECDPVDWLAFKRKVTEEMGFKLNAVEEAQWKEWMDAMASECDAD